MLCGTVPTFENGNQRDFDRFVFKLAERSVVRITLTVPGNTFPALLWLFKVDDVAPCDTTAEIGLGTETSTDSGI